MKKFATKKMVECKFMETERDKEREKEKEIERERERVRKIDR